MEQSLLLLSVYAKEEINFDRAAQTKTAMFESFDL